MKFAPMFGRILCDLAFEGKSKFLPEELRAAASGGFGIPNNFMVRVSPRFCFSPLASPLPARLRIAGSRGSCAAAAGQAASGRSAHQSAKAQLPALTSVPLLFIPVLLVLIALLPFILVFRRVSQQIVCPVRSSSRVRVAVFRRSFGFESSFGHPTSYYRLMRKSPTRSVCCWLARGPSRVQCLPLIEALRDYVCVGRERRST